MKRLLTTLISITILSMAAAWAQYTVKGQVVDEVGPVVGAVVLESGTSNGVETDLDGNFTITVASQDSNLEISLLGYKTVIIPAIQASVVVLEEDSEMLEEVVVIGYGTVKKEDLTGSVATVKADQINKGAITSPAEMLKGKSAGVVITEGDGAPGSGSTIRIRGGSSLNASNDPLIVIDGLPISNSGISGVGDQLSSINPSDIESFVVLKDASATAIYGSRASNGVIIITTKKGSKYDSTVPKINADFTASISQNSKYLDVMTGDEMREVIAAYKGTKSEAFKALGKANTDWQKEIYQLGQSYEANVGIQGIAKFGKAGYMPYRVSGGYLWEDGTLKTGHMDRGTVSLNLTPTFLDEHLTIALNGKGMLQNNQFANTGAIWQAAQYDPTQPIYDDTYNPETGVGEKGLDGYRMWGTYEDGKFATNSQATLNPLASLYQRTDVSEAYRFIGNAQIDYKIHGLEDLRLNLNLGMDYSSSTGNVYIPVGAEQSEHSQDYAGGGEWTEYDQINRNSTLEAYADYSKTIGKHSFGIMAGYSWQHFYTESNSFNWKASEYLAENAEGGIVGADATPLKKSIDKWQNYLVSFFGRANYSYDNRYMVTATVRYDGTSRFVNNKWGLFPSVAFGWNIKGESFLKSAKAVSALKLRLSWGETGQQDVSVDSYAKYLTNSLGSYWMFGDQAIVPVTPLGYNADVKWETTTTYNIGVYYGFFGDRLFGSLDLYYRNTRDLLNDTPFPAGSNLTNYAVANIGNLVNKGIEFEINGVAIQTQDWNWTIGANFAWNDNKITKLTTNDDASYKGVDVGGISGGNNNKVQKHQVGYPVNTFYLFEQVYDENGMPIPGLYVDRDGNGVINDDDRYYGEQPNAVFTVGFNTTLSWKNLSLSIAGHGNFGNWVYNNNASQLGFLPDLWTNGFISNRLSGSYWLNYDRPGFETAEYLSDHWLEDGSFFKIDRITLNYVFDLQKGGALSIFGTVQNVCTFTNYSGIDPEVYGGIDSNIYPRPRTYILGLKYNF